MWTCALSHAHSQMYRDHGVTINSQNTHVNTQTEVLVRILYYEDIHQWLSLSLITTSICLNLKPSLILKCMANLAGTTFLSV